MRVSPGIYYAAPSLWNLEDSIDFWYDSISMCYESRAWFDIIATYIESINDEDYELSR